MCADYRDDYNYLEDLVRRLIRDNCTYNPAETTAGGGYYNIVGCSCGENSDYCIFCGQEQWEQRGHKPDCPGEEARLFLDNIDQQRLEWKEFVEEEDRKRQERLKKSKE